MKTYGRVCGYVQCDSFAHQFAGNCVWPWFWCSPVPFPFDFEQSFDRRGAMSRCLKCSASVEAYTFRAEGIIDSLSTNQLLSHFIPRTMNFTVFDTQLSGQPFPCTKDLHGQIANPHDHRRGSPQASLGQRVPQISQSPGK